MILNELYKNIQTGVASGAPLIAKLGDRAYEVVGWRYDLAGARKGGDPTTYDPRVPFYLVLGDEAPTEPKFRVGQRVVILDTLPEARRDEIVGNFIRPGAVGVVKNIEYRRRWIVNVSFPNDRGYSWLFDDGSRDDNAFDVTTKHLAILADEPTEE